MASLSALGSRKQAILLGVLAVVLVLAVVRWRPGGAPSRPETRAAAAPAPRAAADAAAEEPAPRAGRARSREKPVSPDEVPILSPEDFAVHPGPGGSDTGRDLFDLREPTKPPPPTPFPPPPPPGDTRFIGPLPPPPPTPTPRPPDVTFKFVGTFGPKSRPIAVIQEGDRIYNVRAGDVLFDKFVLRSVGYESIDIGFVGFPETESRRIGITPN
jgi:hypothetical protein